MAETNTEQRESRPPVDTVGGLLGLLVFLCGIGMIVLVFIWTFHLFTSLDEELTGSSVTQVVSPPRTGETANRDEGTSGPVVAKPEGPSLAQNAAKLALKLLCLLILALCGSLVAAKGAHLAGAYRGKRT